MSKQRLYYKLLLKEGNEKEPVWFRKASNLPFPSPIGTSFDVPLFGALYVRGYEHEGRLLYMQLAHFGTGLSSANCPEMEVVNLAEARKIFTGELWEEMDENDEPIVQV